MPRTEYEVDRDRSAGTMTLEVEEVYTLRMTTADGRIIRHDGVDLWFVDGGGSWHGDPPFGWDAEKAVPERSVHRYWNELDCR